jgi:hypothetical protein
MKRQSLGFQVCMAITLFALFVPCYAKGDGGIIRLRETEGPFSVTLFSSPEVVAGGLADVSALIQEKDTGKAVLDAVVSFTLSPPAGSALNQSDEFCGSPKALKNPASVRATREQAFNKLLYAAPLELNAAGDWKLHVIVARGIDTAGFDCLIPVTLRSGQLTGLWPYLLLSPLAVAAFAVNQWLRGQSLQKGIRPSDAL